MSAASGAQRAAVVAALRRYLELHPGEADRLAPLVARLDDPEDLFARASMAGHVTASAFVVDPASGRALLVRHAILGRWLQPGGHVDRGEAAPDAAAREAREETGLAVLMPVDGPGGAKVPFDIDPHRIPANPRRGEAEHWHFDFRHLFVADSASALARDPAETTDARWFAFGELAALDPGGSVAVMADKARAILGRRG